MRIVRVNYLVFLLMLPLVVMAQTHFSSPSSTFQPMNIYVIQATLNGNNMVNGDEIAVFDGSTCAGVEALSGVATSSNPVSLLAYKEDNGESGFNEGHEMTFKAWDASAGTEYTFDDDEVTFYNPTSGAPIGPQTFEGLGTVMVALNGNPDPSACQLTMQKVGNGSTTPASGTHTYPINTTVNIQATPDPGHEFDYWQGDVADPNNATTTVYLDGSKTVTAYFKCIEHTLTMAVNQSGWGSTSPSPGDTTVCEGSIVSIRAIPAAGYVFVNWSGPVADPNNANTTVTVNNDVVVTANFTGDATTYFLTMQVNDSNRGTTTPAVGQHEYNANQVVTVTAQPKQNYRFDHWEGDVADPGSQTTTVTMTANKTVEAIFERIEYDLTMEVYKTGWGTTTPGVGIHQYYSGDVVSLLAQPAQGYRFVTWEGDVANPSSSSTMVTMNADKTVRARFDSVKYTLTMVDTDGGSTTPSAGVYTYLSGDVVPINATPDPDHYFVRWDGGVTDPGAASTTVVMDQNKTVSAIFDDNPKYPLTISISGNGQTSPPPGTYEHPEGTNVQLVATSDPGNYFVNWTGDVAGVSNVGDSTITVLMDRARNITANFAVKNIQYTLTMAVNQAGWGSTDPTVGDHIYNQGTSVPIEALPANGYRFVRWDGGVANENASETTIFMDGDKTATAVFEPIPVYTLNLTIDPPGGGSANLSPGDHDYPENTQVALEAYPNTGYRFSHWEGDVANSHSENTTIIMSSDKDVVLHFDPIPQYTITIQPPDEAMGTTDPPAGTYTLYEGESITIRAIPYSDYEFVNWNNDPTLTSQTITITATSNKTYKPYFKEKDDVTLTMEVNNGAMGDVTPAVGKHTYNKGNVITLEADPEPGYRFSHWDGDVAEKFAATTTIIMDENKQVTANFDHIIYRLFMDKTDGGSVTPPVGTHTYKSWKTVDLLAEPAPGYKFTGWTGDVADRDDPSTTIVMSGDQHVKANFASAGTSTLTLSVSPAGKGETKPSVGTHGYNDGDVVSIEAYPIVTGWVFDEWEGDVADPDKDKTTVTINGDKSVTAKFRYDPDYYTLTLKVSPNSSWGYTTPAVGTYNYAVGETVTITATPQTGYYFVSWSGGVTNPGNPTTTVIMDSDKTITATFASNPPPEYKFTIDVTPAIGGTTTPAVGSYYHPQGTVIKISAHPNYGYRFLYWTGDVAEQMNPNTTVKIDADKGVTAHFEPAPKRTLTMAINDTAAGSVVPAVGEHQYLDGTVVKIQATPNYGYYFDHWEGEVDNPWNANTVVTMDKDKKVKAIFYLSPDKAILTMVADPQAGGTTGPSPGSHIFNKHEKVNITALPFQDYRFSHWVGDVANDSSASTTVTMDKSKTVTAHFVFDDPSDYVVLNISVNPDSGGTTQPVVGAHTVRKNTVVNITATPKPGYQFAGWSGDVQDPKSASTSVFMNTSKSVVANFVDGDDDVIISFNISPVETGTMAPVPGIHIYSRGEVVSISAIPYDGYYFAGWYGDVTNPNTGTTTVVADTNKEITAMFKEGAPPKYPLTLLVSPPDGGVTAPPPGTYAYNENEIVNITTLPSAGYIFTKWTGNVQDTSSQTTRIRMTGPQTVIANFQLLPPNKVTLNMSVDPPGGGLTVPSIGSHAYDKDEVVQVLAIPSNDYRFDRWIGDVENSANAQTSIKMTGDKNVKAVFSPNRHTVTMLVSPEGAGYTVPAVGDTLVNHGDVITIRAIAQNSHRFANWSGDVSSDEPALSIKVQKSMRIIANFVDLDEIITQPRIFAATNAFRKQSVDVFVRNARSNLGHNLEYQFDWGDGQQSNWVNLKSQNRNNITVITTPVGGSGLPSSGQLIDFNTGTVTDISLSVRGGSYHGTTEAWFGEEPFGGTDAADMFSQIVNCRGAINYVNTPTDVLTLELSGLDPSKLYMVGFYSNRNRHSWSQASLITLSGAESFENTSSTGMDQNGNPIKASETAPNTKLPSDNTQTGYLARFTKIIPGNDGEITLSIKFAGLEGHEFKGKYASALVLQEFDPQTNMMTKTAFNDLAWEENFYSHFYSASGAYLVRVRARCKTHPSVVSSWSDVHSIVISGCTFSTTVTEGSNATVKKVPDNADYDYASMVTLTAQPGPNWKFTHWNYDRSDTVATKIVMMNDHKTFRANFKFDTGVEKRDDVIPTEFCLGQNYPNPFNPMTVIEYDIAKAEQVSIKIYDIRGRLVRVLVDMNQPAGRYKVTWDATDAQSLKMPSGIYFYSIHAGDFKSSKRMVLLK
ncbi:T9SS type A sorting domain-containing protein [candidate division KSB1 bacterium]|nr:T9SS type A sorting domain-containing protein [candidate division KSB1 bacterium]